MGPRVITRGNDYTPSAQGLVVSGLQWGRG